MYKPNGTLVISDDSIQSNTQHVRCNTNHTQHQKSVKNPKSTQEERKQLRKSQKQHQDITKLQYILTVKRNFLGSEFIHL